MISTNLIGALIVSAVIGADSASASTISEDDESPEPTVKRIDDAFGLALLRQVESVSADQNLFLSPQSARQALLMVALGARGATADEFADLLRPGTAIPQLIRGVEDRARSENDDQTEVEGVTLTEANAAWFQKGFLVRPEFAQALSDHFNAEATTLRIADASVQAAGTINAWVERKTRGLIRELVTPDDLNRVDALVLTNAIHFKGRWAEAFDEKQTTDRPFRVPDGALKNVPMMSRKGTYPVIRNDDVVAVTIPYAGSRCSMLAVMPAQENRPLEQLPITTESLQEWTDPARPRSIVLGLPKLELETKVGLTDHLKALGLRRAFTAAADFSGISDDPIALDQVLQATALRVDEQGTEAAAATAVTAVRTAAVVRPETIRFDRPFYLFILDQQTGDLLFAGKILDPSQAH